MWQCDFKGIDFLLSALLQTVSFMLMNFHLQKDSNYISLCVLHVYNTFPHFNLDYLFSEVLEKG